MEIRNISQGVSNINTGGTNLTKGADKPEKVGYNPLPSDDYKPEEGEKGFISKVVDGITKFVRKNIIGPSDRFADRLKSDFGTQAMVAGGLIGGAAGAYIGYDAAGYENANTQTDALTWQEPTMQQKHLGNIPSDYYSWSRWDYTHHDYDTDGRYSGGDRVYRQAPVFDGEGNPRMHDVNKTISSDRFGRFG